MCIPYYKTFPMKPLILITWPWPWPLTYIWKTLTLHITSLPLDIGLSYLACVFVMTRPFWWYHKFWSRELTVTFDLHLENFNFAHNFLTVRHRAFIFGTCVSYDNTFLVVPLMLTLTVTFHLHLENFNSAHNFLTIRHKAFKLGKCVLYDKTFPIVLYILIMWPWPWPLTYIWKKNFNSVLNIPNIKHRAFIFNIGWHVLPFTPCYFSIIRIEYHMKMFPLAPHAFLGMLPICKWKNAFIRDVSV